MYHVSPNYHLALRNILNDYLPANTRCCPDVGPASAQRLVFAGLAHVYHLWFKSTRPTATIHPSRPKSSSVGCSSHLQIYLVDILLTYIVISSCSDIWQIVVTYMYTICTFPYICHPFAL